jgi:hypothetical protein
MLPISRLNLPENRLAANNAVQVRKWPGVSDVTVSGQYRGTERYLI